MEESSVSRRGFMRAAALTAGAAALSGVAHESLAQKEAVAAAGQDGLIWGYLIHLGYNMWGDSKSPEVKLENWDARPYLRCDDSLWKDAFLMMKEAGINLAVIDLGEGVQYASHPELAVQGSWSREKLREQLAWIRSLGIEPIPKMNFSTGHDIWLGEYSRCVSTPKYYEVCADLIKEAIELFDKPRFFHLGMDEETAEHQRSYEYCVIRQHSLWWHDILFLIGEVEKNGSRAWIWSDPVWRYPEEFYKQMPKSVLQGNWYYGAAFDETVKEVQAYLGLEKQGYDQIPGGSNWSTPDNFGNMVQYLNKQIPRERLKGFLQTVWHPTLEKFRAKHVEAIDLVKKARLAL